jgi:hypothetical protein
MSRLCYSCVPSAIVDDAKAAACTREHCAARSDVERETKPQGTRPPQHNEPPEPVYFDRWKIDPYAGLTGTITFEDGEWFDLSSPVVGVITKPAQRTKLT